MSLNPRTCAAVFLILSICFVSSAGAQAWEPYNFKGTEHFKYAINSTEEGVEKTGTFSFDTVKQGEDKYKVSYSSLFGEDEFSSTTTATKDELAGKIMMSLMMSGSEAGAILGVTIFTPALGMMMILGGGDLEVGNGRTWTEKGKKMSCKVEAKEKIAGLEGYKCVYREDGEIQIMQVIAPEIALPLHTILVDEEGSRFEAKLLEFKK
jgi:hypothetical protein